MRRFLSPKRADAEAAARARARLDLGKGHLYSLTDEDVLRTLYPNAGPGARLEKRGPARMHPPGP